MSEVNALREALRAAIAAHARVGGDVDSHGFALARLRTLAETTERDHDAAAAEYERHARASVAAVTAWAARGGDGAPPLQAEEAKNRARKQRDEAAELLSTMQGGLRDLERSGAELQGFARDAEARVQEAALAVARTVAGGIAHRMRALAAEWTALQPQIDGYFETLSSPTAADVQIRTVATPEEAAPVAAGHAAAAWVAFHRRLLTDADAEYAPPA